jgi:predicted RNase H-like HicB family nuclease
MRTYNFTIVITPDETTGYFVTCPALPGLVTQGETLEETQAMAADAIQCYVESMLEDGVAIPEDKPSIATSISIKVA